jgi:bud site selection protein 31
MLELSSRLQEAETMCVDENMTREQWSAINKAKWNRSRPVYVMRFLEKKHPMSDALYEWILNQGFADRELINMWRKPGFERLCCLECAAKDDPRGGCICRQPGAAGLQGQDHCRVCWCRGCATNDVNGYPIPEDPLPTLDDVDAEIAKFFE